VIEDADTLAVGAPPPDILIANPRAREASAALAQLTRLRARPGLGALPAILLDEAPTADNQAQARAAGAHLLAKPVRPARLRALMHRLVGVPAVPPDHPA
jgi:CheY-like chemotaxis protein